MTNDGWDAPGPGLWELDAANFPRPLSPAAAELIGGVLEEGFGRGCRRYGVAIDTIEVAIVHGRVYERLLPVTADRRAGRVAEAEAALAERRWLSDTEKWHRSGRAALEQRLQTLGAEPIADYDDCRLAEHLDRVARLARAAFMDHMELHLADMIPFGRFLLECRGWGIPDEVAMRATFGASPASGWPLELEPAAAAVRAANASPRTLDDVRGLGPDAAHAIDRYLEVAGHRAISAWDVDSPTVAEEPSLVLSTVVAWARHRPQPEQTAEAEAVEDLRSLVPASRRSRFAELFADTRSTFGLRDDNAGLTMMWPIGLLRRGFLEADRRYPGTGLLGLTVSGVIRLLRGAPVDGARVQRRAARRAGEHGMAAPLVLGERDFVTPPLPGAQRELTDALLVYFELLGALGHEEPLRGTGIGARPYANVACVATTPDDALDRLAPGAVLIVITTAPAYDPALALAGGLVTDTGGPLSHTAIAARELGIPAVVGAASATTTIRDGDQVEVDPLEGQVRILSRHHQGAPTHA